MAIRQSFHQRQSLRDVNGRPANLMSHTRRSARFWSIDGLRGLRIKKMQRTLIEINVNTIAR